MKCSIELHYHLHCPHCGKWFSLADIPVRLGQPLICPHCGNLSLVSEVKNGAGEEVTGVEWVRPVRTEVGEIDRIILDDEPTID